MATADLPPPKIQKGEPSIPLADSLRSIQDKSLSVLVDPEVARERETIKARNDAKVELEKVTQLRDRIHSQVTCQVARLLFCTL